MGSTFELRAITDETMVAATAKSLSYRLLFCIYSYLTNISSLPQEGRAQTNSPFDNMGGATTTKCTGSSMLWAGFQHHASSSAVILTPRYYPSVLPVDDCFAQPLLKPEDQPLIRTQYIWQEASWLA
jgi:hypothetical protein